MLCAKHTLGLTPHADQRCHSASPALAADGDKSATNLCNDHIDAVPVLHLELIGRLILADAVAVEEEADGLHGHALPLAEGAHELLKLRVRLALEEYCGN